jgi:poly-gamma-glutamate synthesis protein (capsule biosynthesis protein)
VGAGVDVASARAPRVLADAVAVLGASDHPADFAAGADRCGIAYADLRSGSGWLASAVAVAPCDIVLALVHWGPNMTPGPLPYIRRAAHELLAAGATLVAGHSAHVFHGVAPGVLYDLGDFVDDYAVHQELRNDLGLLFLVDLDADGPRALEAVPLKLDFCHTRLATGADAAWIRRRFIAACADLGTTAVERDERVVASLRR